MKILFARHGESLANTLHIISNSDLPHPLTENGRIQATILARRLESRGITSIYTSPVLRALQTAEIVAGQLSGGAAHSRLEVNISPGLSEYYCGVLEGRGDEQAWSMHNRFFHNWLGDVGKSRDESPAGGETFGEIRARLKEFVNTLLKKYGEDNNVEILCVSHGGTLRVGLPGLLTNLDFDFTQTHGLGHTEIIETEIRAGALMCLSWGEHAFPFQI